jgi:hypothetical protein
LGFDPTKKKEFDRDLFRLPTKAKPHAYKIIFNEWQTANIFILNPAQKEKEIK